MKVNNKETLKVISNNILFDKYRRDKMARNKVINEFALSVFGSFDVLEYPICPKCEQVAFWDMGGIYCLKCGLLSKNGVLTFRDYIDSEIMKGGKNVR